MDSGSFDTCTRNIQNVAVHVSITYIYCSYLGVWRNIRCWVKSKFENEGLISYIFLGQNKEECVHFTINLACPEARGVLVSSVMSVYHDPMLRSRGGGAGVMCREHDHNIVMSGAHGDTALPGQADAMGKYILPS